MSIRRFLIITATVVCAAIFAAPAQARSPREYYVALGDSISYGFQTSKALAGLPPSAFDTGYLDVVASRLRHAGRALDVVNYSCPGESTRTISRPCIWRATGHALHDDYAGPQLRTGLRFLRHHADRVPLITITLGGIDIDDFLATCPPGDLGCLQASAPAAIAPTRSGWAQSWLGYVPPRPVPRWWLSGSTTRTSRNWHSPIPSSQHSTTPCSG